MPLTNLSAILAAGGWHLSTAFLSAKAKAQARDSKGRFIEMGGTVRWKGVDGKWRWGTVDGVSPDGSDISVKEHGKTASAKIKPKMLEVVKAVIPDKKGSVLVEPYHADDKTNVSDEPVLYVNTDKFKKVGQQGGSNPGGTYEDPETGERFYVKKAESEQHAANEVLAARLYDAAGVKVPEVYLTELDGQPAVASRIISDLQPLYPGGHTTPETLKEGRKGFAMDAWLANWDSVGLVYDNLMKDKDGNAVRADTGGAMLYRAMGSPKGDLFGNTANETDTLRSGKNPQAGKIFGDMSDADVAADIANTVNNVDETLVNSLIDELPFTDSAKGELKGKLASRKKGLNSKFAVAPKITIPDKPEETPLKTIDKNVSAKPETPINADVTKLSADITSEESIALSHYIGESYKEINNALREKSASTSWIKLQIAALDSALAKSTVVKPVKVYRRVKTMGWLDDELAPGSELEDKGYVSTSMSKHVAMSTFGGSKSKSALFEIDLPSGINALDVSGVLAHVQDPGTDDNDDDDYYNDEDEEYSDEDEIILPHGTKFSVVSDSKDASGNRVIKLKLVGASESLKAETPGPTNAVIPDAPLKTVGKNVGINPVTDADKKKISDAADNYLKNGIPSKPFGPQSGDVNLDGTVVTMAINLNKGDLIKVKGAHVVELDGKFSTSKGVTGTYLTGALKGGKYQVMAHKSTKFSVLPASSIAAKKLKTEAPSATPAKPAPLPGPPPQVVNGDFTDEELEALEEYTDAGYLAVNDYLRNGLAKGMAKEDIESLIERLDMAIATSSTNADSTVYRGISDESFDDLVVGSTLHDKGYVSTSSELENAKNFSAFSASGGSIFQIDLPAGSNVVDVGKADVGYTNEKEFILPRNSSFEITEIGELDGKKYFKAKLVPGGKDDQPQAPTQEEVPGPGQGTPGAPDLDGGPGDGDATAPAAEEVAPPKVYSKPTSVNHAEVNVTQPVPSYHELHALNDYTGSGYRAINAWARYGTTEDGYDEQQLDELVDYMDALISKGTLEAPATFYRGVSAKRIPPAGEINPGDALIDDGYVSMSSDFYTAKAFPLGKTPSEKLLSPIVEVKVPAGAHLLDVTKAGANNEEDEFIFPRSTTIVFDEEGVFSDGRRYIKAHIEKVGSSVKSQASEEGTDGGTAPEGGPVPDHGGGGVPAGPGGETQEGQAQDVGFNLSALSFYPKHVIELKKGDIFRQNNIGGGHTYHVLAEDWIPPAPGETSGTMVRHQINPDETLQPQVTKKSNSDQDLDVATGAGLTLLDSAPKPTKPLKDAIAEAVKKHVDSPPKIDTLEEPETAPAGTPVDTAVKDIKPGDTIVFPDGPTYLVKTKTVDGYFTWDTISKPAGWNSISGAKYPLDQKLPVIKKAPSTESGTTKAAKDLKPGDKVLYGSQGKVWTIKSVNPGPASTVVDLGGGGQLFPNDYKFEKADAPVASDETLADWEKELLGVTTKKGTDLKVGDVIVDSNGATMGTLVSGKAVAPSVKKWEIKPLHGVNFKQDFKKQDDVLVKFPEVEEVPETPEIDDPETELVSTEDLKVGDQVENEYGQLVPVTFVAPNGAGMINVVYTDTDGSDVSHNLPPEAKWEAIKAPAAPASTELKVGDPIAPKDLVPGMEVGSNFGSTYKVNKVEKTMGNMVKIDLTNVETKENFPNHTVSKDLDGWKIKKLPDGAVPETPAVASTKTPDTVGAKVKSKKDGFSGTVVKVNPKSGYSLVQSDDGTKKLWRKWETLVVVPQDKAKYAHQEKFEKGLITAEEHVKETGKPVSSASKPLHDFFDTLPEGLDLPDDVNHIFNKMGFLDDINIGEENDADEWVTNVITEAYADGDLETGDAIGNAYDALKKDAGIEDGYQWDSPESNAGPASAKQSHLNIKADDFSQAMQAFNDPATTTPEHFGAVTDSLNEVGDGSIEWKPWADLKEFVDEWGTGDDGTPGWQLEEAWSELKTAAGVTDQDIDDPWTTDKLYGAPPKPASKGDDDDEVPAHYGPAEMVNGVLSAEHLDTLGELDPTNDQETVKAWLVDATTAIGSGDVTLAPDELTAIKNLAESLGVPVPEPKVASSPSPKTYSPVQLQVGDVIKSHGQNATITAIATAASGTTMAKIVYEDGTVSLPKWYPDEMIPGVSVASDTEGLKDVVPVASLQVGDEVSVLHGTGKTFKVTKIEPSYSGGYKLSVSNAKTGASLMSDSWHDASDQWIMVKKADEPTPAATETKGANLQPGDIVNSADGDPIYKLISPAGPPDIDGDTQWNIEPIHSSMAGTTLTWIFPKSTYKTTKSGAASANAPSPENPVKTEIQNFKVGDVFKTTSKGTFDYVVTKAIDETGFSFKNTVTGANHDNMKYPPAHEFWLVGAAPNEPSTEPSKYEVGDNVPAGEFVPGMVVQTEDGDKYLVNSVAPFTASHSGQEKVTLNLTKIDDGQSFPSHTLVSHFTGWKLAGLPDAPESPAVTGKKVGDEVQPGDIVAGMVISNSTSDKYKVNSITQKSGSTWELNLTNTKSGQNFPNHEFFGTLNGWKLVELPSETPAGPVFPPLDQKPKSIKGGELEPGDIVWNGTGSQPLAKILDKKKQNTSFTTWEIEGLGPWVGHVEFMAHTEDDYQVAKGTSGAAQELSFPPLDQKPASVKAMDIAPGDILWNGDASNPLAKILSKKNEAGGFITWNIEGLSSWQDATEWKMYKDSNFQVAKGTPGGAPALSFPPITQKPASVPSDQVAPGDIVWNGGASNPLGKILSKAFENNHQVTWDIEGLNGWTGKTTWTMDKNDEYKVAKGGGGAPETPATPTAPAVPNGTLVAGSGHVYQDAQGKYVITKYGHVLREGDSVVSSKDGTTGTLTKLELGAKYAKVKTPDGKTKARQIDTLKPVGAGDTGPAAAPVAKKASDLKKGDKVVPSVDGKPATVVKVEKSVSYAGSTWVIVQPDDGSMKYGKHVLDDNTDTFSTAAVPQGKNAKSLVVGDKVIFHGVPATVNKVEESYKDPKNGTYVEIVWDGPSPLGQDPHGWVKNDDTETFKYVAPGMSTPTPVAPSPKKKPKDDEEWVTPPPSEAPPADIPPGSTFVSGGSKSPAQFQPDDIVGKTKQVVEWAKASVVKTGKIDVKFKGDDKPLTVSKNNQWEIWEVEGPPLPPNETSVKKLTSSLKKNDFVKVNGKTVQIDSITDDEAEGYNLSVGGKALYNEPADTMWDYFGNAKKADPNPIADKPGNLPNGAIDLKGPDEFQPGDVVGDTFAARLTVQSVKPSESAGSSDVTFVGVPQPYTVPNDTPWTIWPKEAGKSLESVKPTDVEEAIPDVAPEPETPDVPEVPAVPLTDDVPHPYTTPSGGTIEVPVGHFVYEGPAQYQTPYAYVTDGFGDWKQYNAATGELASNTVYNTKKAKALSSEPLFVHPAKVDLTPNVAGTLTDQQKTQVVAALDDYTTSHSDYGTYTQYYKALKKLIEDPSGSTMLEGDLQNAYYGASGIDGLKGIDDSTTLSKALQLEVLKLTKQKTSTYTNEWYAGSTSGQFHYNATQRKALAAVGLSENALAFVNTKYATPASSKDSAAEIYATLSDPKNALAIDSAFGSDTAASILIMTTGSNFMPALSGNQSKFAAKPKPLPTVNAANGFARLGDTVIAKDGQGGTVVLVSPLDGRIKVRRPDGTHFTRKGTQFTVTGSPQPGVKPVVDPSTPAPLASKPYVSKPRPPFKDPDWSTTLHGTASVTQVLEEIKKSDAAGNHGYSFAADYDQIEDLDVHVSRVLSSSGQELIELKFKITPRHGKELQKRYAADPNWTSGPMKVERRDMPDFTQLAKLTGANVVSDSSGGKTLRHTTSDGVQIQLHQTNKIGSGPYAYHNLMQVRLPADANQSDIMRALYDAGIDQPGPATAPSLKRFAENRLMSIFASQTNANTETTGEMRDSLLAKIKKDWGITWEDMQVHHGTNGRIELLVPQKVADKIVAKTKVDVFTHHIYGGNEDFLSIVKGPHTSLLSTTVRWSEGVPNQGSSSHADIGTGGADYVFLHPQQGYSTGLHFDAKRMFRRTDFYANHLDKYGRRLTNVDVLGEIYPGAYETMFKHRVSMDDALGYVVNSSVRANLLAKLKEAGITHIGGRTIEQFIVTSSSNFTPPDPLVVEAFNPEALAGEVAPAAGPAL